VGADGASGTLGGPTAAEGLVGSEGSEVPLVPTAFVALIVHV
jgi:hypothetical protein